MQLTNTLTGRKEEFKPIVPGRVGLYVCGITPYDETHLGHARCYVIFDLLKRTLLKVGYTVRHIQNFTDVDDKIIKRANEVNQPVETYPQPFIDGFKTYMKKLNVLPADEYPLVTTHIPEIVALIKRLVERGFAYTVDGDVYYEVRKFGAAYGQLSKRNIDELESGARVGVDERKKDPLDFALWKASKPGEPAWESPWGKGRPGWHIECSAMSMKYLGEEFDIHGGGMDLIFPHHSNEIAQSSGASGKKFAHVWVHNGFVTIDDEKMSKSLGNFFTVKDILAKFDPMVVRYFLLSQHYRSPLNFSDKALEAARSAWRERVMGAYQLIKERAKAAAGAGGADQHTDVDALMSDFRSAMKNDLNSPEALAALNGLCTLAYEAEKNKKPAAYFSVLWLAVEEMFSWLGLVPVEDVVWPAEILSLVDEREAARRGKNWKRSDEIRDLLRGKGVLVEDASSGPRLKKID